MLFTAITRRSEGESGSLRQVELLKLNRPICSNRRLTTTLRIMQLTGILLLACSLTLSARSVSQTVTFKGTNVPLEKVLDEVNRQTGYVFITNTDEIKMAKNITVDLNDIPLRKFLQTILKDQALEFLIKGKNISIKKSASLAELMPQLTAAVAPPITGIVRGPDGQPLSGVNIIVKGTKRGTVSGVGGKFSLEAKEGEIIIFSSIGYADRQVVVGNSASVQDIKLLVSESKLDEVQIIAYGTTSSRLSTGNISSVKAKDIERSPVSNPLLAVQGRVPGVFIQQASGVPGSGVKVLIQGRNSISSGNDPFYVIDGVPYTSQLLPGLADVGESGSGAPGTAIGTAGNPLNYINIQDIESIDVLKDADATSIYGSRAANGAIIITTKKAKAGKTTVNINVQNGWSAATRKVKQMNTEQYLEMRREFYINDNKPVPTNPAIGVYDVTFWDTNRYTDWQKELLGNTAKSTNIITSVSGGNSSTQFLLSGGYQREGTITPGDLRDQKASLHFNLSNASDNKRFRINFTGNYVYDDNKLAGMSNLATNAFTLAPNAPRLYNNDGTLNWELLPNGTYSFYNPLAFLENGYVNKTTNLVSNVLIAYQLMRGLEIKTSIGYNTLETEEIQTYPLSPYPPYLQPFISRTSNFNNATIKSWIIEPQATYVKTIGAGKLEALLGLTIQDEKRDRERLNAEGFSSDQAMFNIKAAASVTVDQSADAVILSQYKYNAVFGRLNYNWKDKYLINVSARRDGSSRFGTENKFHNFSSAAAAWIFSSEPFIAKNLRFLSFGKIRASYGTTGSDQIGDYTYLNLYQNTATSGSLYQNIVGLEPLSNFPNPYLQWEETRKFSATMDLGFWEDRILLNLTYYKNRSSNQLGLSALPSSTGGEFVNMNLPSKVQNTGLELGLNTVNFRGQFNWSSSLNITIPKNKLLAYNDIDGQIYIEDGLIGKPLGVLKAYKYLGVDPSSGLYTVADKDGKQTSAPNASTDKTVFIDLNPLLYGGLQNSLSYKQFSLDVLFQFVNQKGNSGYFGDGRPGFTSSNQSVDILDRWKKAGDNAKIQRLGSTTDVRNAYNAATQSNKAYADAGYVRLKNLSFSYSLPSRLIGLAKLQTLRIYAQGQNLLTITNYAGADPENRTLRGMPLIKIFTLGIQVAL